jgi:hypothetical protein
MRQRAEDAEAVRGLLAERRLVLRRSVRALPGAFLAAMDRGLAKHREQLVPGRLFKSPDGGGCAVGVMLRELEPETYSRGRLRFWLRDRWRGGSRSYHGELARNPRLKHIEWIFDDIVELLRRERPGLSLSEAAALAGDCVREEIARELGWRQVQRSARAPAAPDRVPLG